MSEEMVGNQMGVTGTAHVCCAGSFRLQEDVRIFFQV